MRGKFGFAVVLLALAAFVASESQSFGGHRRRGRCSSCYSGCGPSGCSVPAAPAEESPSDATAKAPSAPAVPETDAVASPSDAPPQSVPSVTSRGSNNVYYFGRRGRGRWRRR
jgi:hypothetical protein